MIMNRYNQAGGSNAVLRMFSCVSMWVVGGAVLGDVVMEAA